MKKALVVGIDEYPSPNGLNGCVNDANKLASLLESNGDGTPNFDVLKIVSNEVKVEAKLLSDAITNLFNGEAETVLLYFAGHGFLNETTNNGYLVTQDGKDPHWGVSLVDILQQANKAHPKIKSSVILLDSCQSGFAGKITGLGQNGIDVIGNGLTILTACHKNGVAAEEGGYGKFTNIILDGLGGAASDVIGRITPASLYAHVDQTLGAWEQRPIYKANVQTFITLRSVEPRVSKTVLRRLPDHFPCPEHVFKLDPSYEPDRGEHADRLKSVAVDKANVLVYRDLQQCNRHGLVVPTGHEHMWHAAVFSGGCRLTPQGVHFRRLAKNKKI